MTQDQWTWLAKVAVATQQREITNDEGYEFKFINEWDADGRQIVIVEKRDSRGVFRYSYHFESRDNIAESVRTDLHNLWEITQEIKLKYKTVIEQYKMGTL